MKDTKKTVLVVLLILLIEALYLQADPISFGFPFRSVIYRTGISESFLGEELPLGFNVEPILLVCDILFVFLLALLLIQCFPLYIIVLLLQGFIFGLAAGGTVYFLDKVLPESLLSTMIAIFVIFLLTPLIIYILSLKNKRQKTAILIISFTTITTFYYSWTLLEALLDGTYGVLYNWEVILRLMTFPFVPVFECFILMLLHKKLLPLILWNKKIGSTSESMAQDAASLIESREEKTNRKLLIKRAILYVSLLAITSYIGHHFVTVRKMYNDDLLVTDAIESKLERLNIIHHHRLETSNKDPEIPMKIASWSMELKPESFNGGLNASFTTEVEVNDEKYYTKVKKHFFVPWLNVEIRKTEDTE
jgi:hypothetical protein